MQLHWHWPFEKRTIPRKTPYSCLPCQREVDWRQGTNCCFVAFCLQYAHPVYITNFFAVKTEGLSHQPLAQHQPFQKPHYPLPCTITLASPRKRGGGTADIIFWLTVQYSDSPAFTILKLFRAVTVGIAPHPHHHWDFPHYPSKIATTLAFKWTLRKCCLAKKNYR